MHEYALAEAVLRAALEVAEREGLRTVAAIAVRVGELQQIDPDIFQTALAHVRPRGEPRLDDVRITVEVEKARLCCRVCAHAFAMAEAAGAHTADDLESVHFVPELAHAVFACPACGSPDFEVTAGRGVSIASMEGEDGGD